MVSPLSRYVLASPTSILCSNAQASESPDVVAPTLTLTPTVLSSSHGSVSSREPRGTIAKRTVGWLSGKTLYLKYLELSRRLP